MSKQYTVAVIGSTGNVGYQILNSLAERKFPVKKIVAIASEKSGGKKVSFGDDTIPVQHINDIDFSTIDIAFFCAGSAVAEKYARQIADKGCLIIDKSSFFRLNAEVPLIIPEVNAKELENFSGGIIASPNCCTIPLCVALKPLDNAVKIKRIILSTYQSVSGAGKKAMDELYIQTKAKFVFEDLTPKIHPNRIAFNLFPHIGDFRTDGYTDEEYKIQQEVKKILGQHINVTATCVRVPVFVSHSMSVNIEFEEEFDAIEAEEILSEADGIVVYSLDNEIKYAMPIDSVENDEVFVSRIRNDSYNKKCLNMWICADNLRKGAGLNAVQIAEYIITKT